MRERKLHYLTDGDGEVACKRGLPFQIEGTSDPRLVTCQDCYEWIYSSTGIGIRQSHRQ